MSSTQEAYWRKKQSLYATEDWSSKPSIFAQQAIEYFPVKGKILELGSGLGQDGSWFRGLGYEVTMTDLIVPEDSKDILLVDMAQSLPFDSETFSIVYAHLSLHYFSERRTTQLFKEIFNVLKPGGILAFLVNSVNDPEAQEGVALEKNFVKLSGISKRYFDKSFTEDVTRAFKTLLLDEQVTSYKDQQSGRNDLIGYIGRKTS